MLNFPKEYRRRVIGTYGDAASDWLDQLPSVLNEASLQWSLTLQPTDLIVSYNVIIPVTRADGSPAMLKAGFPGDPELHSEIAALQYYNRGVTVRLLESEPDKGIMLLERILPGMPLSILTPSEDQRATAIAAQMMQQFWQPPPSEHHFRHVRDWADGLSRMRNHYDGGTGPLPIDVVDKAEKLFGELLSNTAEDVLLHGDLHHYNILSAGQDQWVIIDPKGILGEPAYETGAILRNPVPQVLDWPNLPAIQARRLDILTERLGIERERIRGYALAQAILSAWWSVESHQDWRPAIALARSLDCC